ncbi:uncharacterized protein LOC118237378 isoform X2 [Anguilla anguilla]|uniref:uncharacterized protein LOC118237378 isoform X2 n=1 Tax=Anguilla anguilla TaxID=7936 RepID=UPI0015AA49C4|nr:uncharacterized protein LOC118237378 isoform X2 [Anguilla anguilla]
MLLIVWTRKEDAQILNHSWRTRFPRCQWSSESEGERGLNEFQRKMKREHQQALACVHKACIVVERNRRKRVTVSCNKLRQLLPQVSGARSDMVTVLEMTVAFLEYVNQATLEHLNRECLFPPDDVCRWWLSETHQKRWLSHKQGCMEQKTTCHFRSRKNSSPLNAVHREKLSGRVIPKGPLSTPRMLSTILRPHAPLKLYYTPFFWYSPTQSPVTSGNPLQITMDCSSETGSKDKLLSSKPTSMSKWFRNAEQE